MSRFLVLKHKAWLALILLSITLLTSSCGTSFPNTDTWGFNDLGLQIWVDKTQVQVGMPIQIRFSVTNVGDEAEVIELADRPVMDIWISFESWAVPGRTTIYWSDGREITGDMRRLVLQPGETRTLEMTWTIDPLARDRTVNVAGILRFGEREAESTGARVTICVASCLP